jgi:hypothetical protein
MEKQTSAGRRYREARRNVGVIVTEALPVTSRLPQQSRTPPQFSRHSQLLLDPGKPGRLTARTRARALTYFP